MAASAVLASHGLAELEQDLRRAYSAIIEQHGLQVAMQALGRLMLGGPPSAVASTTQLRPPLEQVPVATTTTSHATPIGPSLGAAATGRPAPSIVRPRPASSPFSGVKADEETEQTPSPKPRVYAPLDSIKPVPSATLSQMPSGVLSLISPSLAGEDADGEADSTSPDRADPVAIKAASAGVGMDVPQTGSPDGTGKAADAVAAASNEAGGAGGGKKLSLAVLLAGKAAAGVPSSSGPAADGNGVEPSSPRSTHSGLTKGGSLWQRAIHLSKEAADPWASRNLHALHMERAVRQRYNPHTGQWVTDEVLVKVESKPFAAGAMRECYAAKKLSTFTHSVDWHKAQNMVAKRYKKEGVRKSVYYNDMLVQMDAKMLGEMYSKTDPPKQVDVMQCAILQFPGRPGCPLYGVEQLIEGDYVKYNSNSGYVKGDDVLRNTPQAFSHFTWELTKGLKICVDIQGVGDIYTDPQLHTLDGEGYGEGNLGLRGMALFFRSHECNALCRRLALQPFDRCDTDVRSQGYCSESSASASATRGAGRGATAARTRTLARTVSQKARMAAERKRREEQHAAMACVSEAETLAALQDVPKESPAALVHAEIAKLYGEVVLLPELRPAEDPDDCLRGGLFHLSAAAKGGCLLGLLALARAHCGLEPTAPQWAQLFKVGAKQRLFAARSAVAWRCCVLAAERGVRGAVLAVAAAYGSGAGLLAEGAGLEGAPDPAQAARWYGTALELPDLLAEDEEEEGPGGEGDGGHGPISEGDEEAAGGSEGGDGHESDSSLPGSASRASSGLPATGTRAEGAEVGLPNISALSDLDLGRPSALAALRVPRLDELRPSRAFLARLKRAAEEEAAALPGAAVARYELLHQYGSVLLAGGPGLAPDPARAAELLEEAAEAAGAAGKGRLAQRYYELAAQASAAAEEGGDEE